MNLHTNLDLTAYGLVLGAVLGIFAVSATFSRDFFRLMGWVWELFWRFLRFQLLFSYFFRLMGWILGAVLKVLWIIAPQDLPTMLSTYGYCTLCYANRAIIRCSQQGKNHKNSTNLSLQKFWYKKRNINQKPTKLNLKPCRILSKTANHLSILKILIEIFKIPVRNAPRILIYYMEKWTRQQKQREKFRKKRKNFKRKIKKKFYEKYSWWRGKNIWEQCTMNRKDLLTSMIS